MTSRLSATFIPSCDDDYYMPEVVAPSPQRVTPQVPQNMQDDLQRLELEASQVEVEAEADSREHFASTRAGASQAPRRPDKIPEPTDYRDHHYTSSTSSTSSSKSNHNYSNINNIINNINNSTSISTSTSTSTSTSNIVHTNNSTTTSFINNRLSRQIDSMGWDEPSFSPFPKVTGDNVPPADDEKEKILWKARDHVLHSQNISMQITWARDVLIWAEISMDAVIREAADKSSPRPSTPRIEHELRVDALNIIRHLASQEHPDALYIRAKWFEFGKFGERVDKREAYAGYKLAAELGNARSEYRMGMLFEQSNDMSKAKEHYYKGLSLKDSAAQYRMGMISLLGQHGESKDYQGGLERIRNAAEGADEDAPQGAYVYGMLIARDLPDINVPEGLITTALDGAKMYIEKAAYLGFAKAQLKMGQAYELCQLGCEFNPSYSLHYYGLAAKQGIPEAALGVSRWFLFGYEGVFKKNEELAFKYAHEAASAKLPTGEFAMGYYHEIGIHVPKSITEARKWYQLAADHGNKDAVGRLESLSQDKSLSKQDHETTTLTRIKSQHGSQRGKRPDRFANKQQQQQQQQMPTLSERSGPPTPVNEAGAFPRPSTASAGQSPRVSPLPSPGMRPTIVTEHTSFPDPSRASLVSSDRPPAFNIRLDTEGFGQPLRGLGTAPYPVEDRPQPLNVRSKSTAPYPEDDTRPSPNQAHHHANPNYPLGQGPQADRAGSAFGIMTGGMQPSQPGPNAGGRGRGGPGGWDPQGRGYQQADYHGPNHGPGRPYAGDGRGGPPGGPPYGGGPGDKGRPPNQGPGGRPFGGPPNGPGGPPGPPQPGNDRFGRGPGPSFPERQGSLPPDARQRVPTGLGSGGPGPQAPAGPQGPQGPQGPGGPLGSAGEAAPRPLAARVGTAPAGPSAPAAATAKPGKGPATFEDMGIPQGKQDGECVVM